MWPRRCKSVPRQRLLGARHERAKEGGGMFSVELYGRVRYACHVEGLSQRETARRFGIDPKAVRKMLTFAVPPGYRRSKPPARPKLDPFTPIINRILEADRSAPSKQRHTAKRIYERLRDEHAYVGGYTIVKDYVREQQARAQEVFVPLVHPPGHAQVDFGEAVAVIGGVRQAIHLFCLDLPQSDAGFVKAYPAERTEAFLDGHVSAFSFLGGVPCSATIRMRVRIASWRNAPELTARCLTPMFPT